MFFVGGKPAVNPPTEDTSASQAVAVQACVDWLSLVDAEQYAESWNAAAQYFKDAVPRDQWIQAMEATRKPLGVMISRELASREYRTSLPGAPDGEYVVAQMKTSFNHKRSAIETVTLMLEKDGVWRVSGYFIK